MKAPIPGKPRRLAATLACLGAFAASLAGAAGPPWQGVEQDNDGWLHLPWFGHFKETSPGWIYHTEHGWQFVSAQSTASLWLYDSAIDCWLWTSEGVYPYLFKSGINEGWYLYQRNGATPNRLFNRLATLLWTNEHDLNVDKTPIGFSLIPAGTFQMGDPFGDSYLDRPVHTVYVSPFYIQQAKITKAQWDEVTSWAGPRGYDLASVPVVADGADYPALGITWFAALKYANARSEREGLTPVYSVGGSVYRSSISTPSVNGSANGYRLPTEAEWEKAARGGLVGKRFPWGDTISHANANYYSSADYAYDVSPTRGGHPLWSKGTWGTNPAGSFPANGYGLYDVCGNELDWCWDGVSNYPSGYVTNPTGNPAQTLKIVRGGNWGAPAYFCRVAARVTSETSGTANAGAIRLVRRVGD